MRACIALTIYCLVLLLTTGAAGYWGTIAGGPLLGLVLGIIAGVVALVTWHSLALKLWRDRLHRMVVGD